MWKTPDRFWAEIGPYDHILALKKGQIHCAAVDLALFRKPYLIVVKQNLATQASIIDTDTSQQHAEEY
jgi:hypothetical protein